MKLYFYCNSFN